MSKCVSVYLCVFGIGKQKEIQMKSTKRHIQHIAKSYCQIPYIRYKCIEFIYVFVNVRAFELNYEGKQCVVFGNTGNPAIYLCNINVGVVVVVVAAAVAAAVFVDFVHAIPMGQPINSNQFRIQMQPLFLLPIFTFYTTLSMSTDYISKIEHTDLAKTL